jgi:hypothetical protein
LAVGCFGGVAVREVVFPARAASGTTYTYRIIRDSDLVNAGGGQRDGDPVAAEEQAVNRMARGGWRLVAASASYDYFEHVVGGSDDAPAPSPPAPPPPNAP